MKTTILSCNGRVTIPKAIRSRHHWKTGTRFLVEDVPSGILLKPLNIFPATALHSGLGCVKYEGPAISLDEIQTAINDDQFAIGMKEKINGRL